MRFVCMHGHAVPMGHWFEGLIFVIKGGLSVYLHNIWHRVNGGPHSVGGNMPIFEVPYPFG